jgi:putative acetyltransferase
MERTVKAAALYEVRSYTSRDEDATVALWLRTWKVTYPDIDFDARVTWWRGRWRDELLPKSTVVVAEHGGTLIGFVTIEPATGYLDQIVVAPEAWGTGVAESLLTEAKRLSPGRIDLLVNTDNDRAVRFYRKHGFEITGADVSLISRRPVHKMSWRGDQAPSNCSLARRA